MTKNNGFIGHIACFSAYLIFGLNIIVCKDIANLKLISPLGLFCFRAIGATLLFWLCSLFLPKEKIEKRDMIKIFIASMLGLYLTQMCFLKAITITTALDTSIIASFSPIMTMLIAAIYLKEPITWKKAGGVALSFAGVMILIFNSVSISSGVSQTQPLGVLLIIGNSLFFALYLGIFRPLISKYRVITFMKWMFLFSMLVSVPMDLNELFTLDYSAMPTQYLLELLFLILFSTFIAYFLIPIGQKALRPTIVSMYSYMQPIVAAILSIYLGMDNLTILKVMAAICVFAGVVIVNQSKARVR
ncbi:MAG: DMT family transporter [Paludibacteraceae bacterium]|nr:DMT family transporter [Paludibacteraceae bacterium]